MLQKITLIILCGLLPLSCEEFVSVDAPISSIANETVYSDERTAIAAMLGVYHQMVFLSGFAQGRFNSVGLLAGLASDELSLKSTAINFAEFNQNRISPVNTNNHALWSTCYQTIYMTNSIIEGLAKSETLPTDIKTQLDGEARFVRAFCYFQLANLFGDVPLITSTDYRINAVASRNPVSEIYGQIVNDLITARATLSDPYLSATRARPNKAAASALLSRVYLYLQDWQSAEVSATEVIENSLYNIEQNINAVFLSGSREVIWHLIPTNGTTTNEGATFILTATPNFSSPVSLTEDLLNAFEGDDLRRSNWIGAFSNSTQTFYYSYKYKNKRTFPIPASSEYSVVLRLAEQVLIRAEARARQNNLEGAASDVDIILVRAGLPSIQDTWQEMSQETLLTLIAQQRRLELFTEWGHRWFDLKRTDTADEIMQAQKPEWDPTDILFPIPQQEMNVAPNLKPQNPGY